MSRDNRDVALLQFEMHVFFLCQLPCRMKWDAPVRALGYAPTLRDTGLRSRVPHADAERLAWAGLQTPRPRCCAVGTARARACPARGDGAVGRSPARPVADGHHLRHTWGSDL